MKRKSNILAGLMLAVNFLSDLIKELRKLNVTEEDIFNALKSRDGLITKIARKIAELIADPLFFSFFTVDGPVKFILDDNFSDWLSQKFEYVSGLPESRKEVLSESMNSTEIVEKFGIKPYKSISELLTVIHNKIVKQLNGDKRGLFIKGKDNLLFLDFNGQTVVVRVYCLSDDCTWYLLAYNLDDRMWDDGSQVFSRS